MDQCRSAVVIRSRDVGWAAVDVALNRLPELCVIGEATTAKRGLELTRTLRPDVLLTASEVGGIRLRPLLAELRHGPCRATIIVLFANRLVPAEMATLDTVDVDAHFLWGELSSESLYHGLAAVISGEVVAASRPIVEVLLRRPPVQGGPQDAKPALSRRERDVLALLATGATRGEIAIRTGLSQRTIERIVADIQHKLDAATPLVLGMKAAKLGLLP